VDDIESNDEVKVVVVTGEGKAFVAGADISAMVDMSGEEAEAFSRHGQRVFSRLEELDQPVIAAVNGYCLGGGCELAMSCDFRLSSNKAKYGQPEVNLGVVPGFGGSQRLPVLVGIGRATELLTTGRIIGADEALRIGLVDWIYEPEVLFDETYKIAKTIASKCPDAVKFNKKAAMASQVDLDFDTEARIFGECFASGNAKIGMQAFLDKTEPNWR